MDSSTRGFLVLHYLLEFALIHVRWVDDAIQPSLPLSSPSPPAFNLSQHQGLFQWFNSPHQVATIVLPVNIQGWFPLGWTGWISLQSKGLSRVLEPTPQFKSTNSLVLSFLYSPTLTFIHDYWKKHNFHSVVLCQQMMCLLFRCCLGLSQLFFQGARIF